MTTQAELLFSGGAIYTADATTRRMTRAVAADGGPAGAVAVAGGRITALGRDAAGLDELTGVGTEVVDLRGRALLPGAPGSARRRCGWPAWTGTRRTRRTAGSSASPTAPRRAPCTRARPAWSAGWCPS
jgi:hypothetical protein